MVESRLLDHDATRARGLAWVTDGAGDDSEAASEPELLFVGIGGASDDGVSGPGEPEDCAYRTNTNQHTFMFAHTVGKM